MLVAQRRRAGVEWDVQRLADVALDHVAQAYELL